ncbi:MAG: hypothetical protein ACMG6H_06140 [Acidobacteriota bacterium]
MKTENSEAAKPAESNSTKKRWQPMKVTHVGEAKDVVRSGGGKTSPNPADPGEVFKPPGTKA